VRVSAFAVELNVGRSNLSAFLLDGPPPADTTPTREKNAAAPRHIKKYCDLAKQKNLLDLAMRELNLSLPATGF
jgi:hypothetical protein